MDEYNGEKKYRARIRIIILGPEVEILRRTPWSRIWEQNSVYKEFLEIVGTGKPTDNVWKETIVVSATIWISVGKVHHQIRLRILSCSRMSENHRGPEVPEVKVRVVECRDGLARITLEELAITHFVKDGTLQNACTTRPRVVAVLERSAHSHTIRLMTQPTKRSKSNNDKSAVAILKKGNWQEKASVSRCFSRSNGATCEKKLNEIGTKFIYTSVFWCTTIRLRISGHDAAEVYSPGEHWYAEADPACEIHKGFCASYQNSRPKSLVRLHLSRWTTWGWPQRSKIWASFIRRDRLARGRCPRRSVEVGQKCVKTKGAPKSNILLTFGK